MDPNPAPTPVSAPYPPRIAALIAAHDEEAHVGGVVAGLAPYGLARILVVDDNSDDGTARIALEAGAEVLSLRRPQGGGKGQALRAGLAALRSDDLDFILFIDGDGQHDPKDFQGFVDYLAQHPDADFLIGSRFQNRAIIPKARWRTNALGSWTLGRIAGVKWEDSQSGFRLIRKKVLDRIDLRSTGFAIEMEISMKASDWKLHWAHIPIQAIYHGGKSHFRGAMDTWLIAWFSLQC
ncbi:MAG: glycosyltransferase family 2 protein [Holophagaceae bacterium]|nr:glycosyltransferase family 2 protein [Holophagaceae bacterium]